MSRKSSGDTDLKLDDIHQLIADNLMMRRELQQQRETCSSLSRKLDDALLEIERLKSHHQENAASKSEGEPLAAKVKWLEAHLKTSLKQQSDNAVTNLNVQKALHENRMKKVEAKMAAHDKLLSTVKPREMAALSVRLKVVEKGLASTQRDAVQLHKEHKTAAYKMKAAEEAVLKVNRITSTLRYDMQLGIEKVAALRNRGSSDGVLLWKIPGFRKKMAEAASSPSSVVTVVSEPFRTGEFGYRMVAHADCRADRLGVFVEFLPGEMDSALPAVFLHRRTFQLLDQSRRTGGRHVVRHQQPAFGSDMPGRWMTGNWGNPSFAAYSLLENNGDVYLKDDAVFLQMVVEPLDAVWAGISARDGRMSWRIAHYGRTKMESLLKIREFRHSSSFYSAPGGYLMRARLQFAHGQLRVWPDFLLGEHDANLPYAFSHRTTFVLVDRSDAKGNGNDLTQRVTLDVGTLGLTEARLRMGEKGCDGVVFPLDKLERPPYLLDDTILLRIEVDEF